MSEQYLRTGQRSGRRGLWFALGGIVIAAVAVALLAVGPGGEARAQQENLTFDEVLDRVEEARARIESVSYRLVMNTQYLEKHQHNWEADHAHRTVDVLEQGELRRARMRIEQVYEESPERDQETTFGAVVNDHAIGVRRGTITDVWDLELIGAENEAWERLRTFANDYLRNGFGIGLMDLRTFRGHLERLDGPDVYRARMIERQGRTVIELRPREWDEGGPRGGILMIVEPERGYLITYVRFYTAGDLTGDIILEPTLVKDEAGGGDVWLPGRVEKMDWHTDDTGERRLRQHSILRFEDVRLNLPVPDNAFSLPVALEWEEYVMDDGRHLVEFWDEQQTSERAFYRDGELGEFQRIARP